MLSFLTVDIKLIDKFLYSHFYRTNFESSKIMPYFYELKFGKSYFLVSIEKIHISQTDDEKPYSTLVHHL